jgi:serine protease Do
LAAGLSALEDRLDDCTVRISSTKGKRQLSLLGTVISRDGLIVSKGSDVGESPSVVDHRNRKLPGKVVARDDDNDLVLLRVDAPMEHFVDLGNSVTRTDGEILLSPRPHDAAGLISILGSRAFPSAKKKPIGFLGVILELCDDGVALKEVGDGPARKAGLKPKDVVLKLDSQQIETMDELVNAVRSREPGQEVRVTIKRGADEKLVNVTLGSRPHNSGMHVADAFAGGSSLRRTGFEAIFCHDAHAQPHECGGPVFDTLGNVVGINIARFSRTCCYAMPADVIRKSVERHQRQTLQATNTTANATPPPED